MKMLFVEVNWGNKDFAVKRKCLDNFLPKQNFCQLTSARTVLRWDGRKEKNIKAKRELICIERYDKLCYNNINITVA